MRIDALSGETDWARLGGRGEVRPADQRAAVQLDVDVTDLSVDLQSVELFPTVGGLGMLMTFSDFYGWVSAVDDTIACPDAVGSATSEAIVVTAEMSVNVASSGITVELETIDVAIEEIELDIQEGVGQLFDWVINWSEDDLTRCVKDELEAQVAQQVTPLVGGLLEEIADFTFEFELPAIPPNTQTLPMRLVVSPSDAVLTPSGLELALSGGFGVTKGIDHTSPGSIAGGCVGATEGPAASCAGSCGGKTPSGCWCDSQCAGNGDCCADYWAACGSPPTDGLGECCGDSEFPGCAANSACESCVCDDDSFCCNVTWDGVCVKRARRSRRWSSSTSTCRTSARTPSRPSVARSRSSATAPA